MIARMAARVYRRTGTTSNDWGASGADLVDGLNDGNARVLSIIRGRSDNFFPTDWTTTDLSNGTITPVFDALYHELVPLWVEYQYAADNSKKNAAALLAEIQLKEAALTRFYGSRLYKIFTGTIASPGVFTRPNHGLKCDDRVILSTTGALPTGLAVATWYYVISGGLTGDAFELSATKGGAAINTSGSQSGTHYFASDQQGRIRLTRESNK